MAMATSTSAEEVKPSKPRLPRLPLSLLSKNHNDSVTKYKNELFNGVRDESEQLESLVDDKDEGTIELAMNCLLTSERRKERCSSGVLVGSNEFLSPRSGCLTPLSSARLPGSSIHSRYSQNLYERECTSLPNSAREPYGRNEMLLRCPLRDSLRSRFSKNTATGENITDSDFGQHRQTMKGPLEQKLLQHGITPIFEPKNTQEIPKCLAPLIPDVSDLRFFLICSGPKQGGQIQCHIRRVVNAYNMYPRYKLFLTKGDFFLLSARKRMKIKTSNYIISVDEDDISMKTGNYFGNVQSNFTRTKYWFYDKGDTPKINRDESWYSRPTDRVELGAVLYDPDLFGVDSPRKMTAIIPAIDSDDRPFKFDPELKDSPNILDRYYKGIDREKMVIMKTKMPEWNQELKSYCLNFNGRATHASVKNFQLVTEFNNDYIILQLGKAGKNYFTMDYRHPMSALQAFSICLSSLDHKFACISSQALSHVQQRPKVKSMELFRGLAFHTKLYKLHKLYHN